MYIVIAFVVHSYQNVTVHHNDVEHIHNYRLATNTGKCILKYEKFFISFFITVCYNSIYSVI